MSDDSKIIPFHFACPPGQPFESFLLSREKPAVRADAAPKLNSRIRLIEAITELGFTRLATVRILTDETDAAFIAKSTILRIQDVITVGEKKTTLTREFPAARFVNPQDYHANVIDLQVHLPITSETAISIATAIPLQGARQMQVVLYLEPGEGRGQVAPANP